MGDSMFIIYPNIMIKRHMRELTLNSEKLTRFRETARRYVRFTIDITCDKCHEPFRRSYISSKPDVEKLKEILKKRISCSNCSQFVDITKAEILRSPLI